MLPLCRTVCLYGDPSSPYVMKSDAPMPQQLPPNHALVQVYAVSLNPCDAKEVLGDKLPQSWTRLRSWIRKYYLGNKIPGFDFSGVVVKTSTDSNHNGGFVPGDAVFGTVPPFVGTLSNYIVAPVDQVYYKPSKLTWEEAAALPLVGLTCLQVLQPHSPLEGKSVLVVGGSGGTGHMGIQVARALGAKNVVAVCSDRNLDFCREECGATEAVSYTTANADSLQSPGALLSTLRQSSACPFSVVLDCVTSADPRDGCIDYPSLIQQQFSPRDLSSPSSMLLTSDYVYRRLGGPPLDWVRAGLGRITGLQRLWWRNQHEKLFWIRLPQSAGQLKQLQEWADAGIIKPKISQTYNFTTDGIQCAVHSLLSRRVQGKVVVRVQAAEAAHNKDSATTIH